MRSRTPDSTSCSVLNLKTWPQLFKSWIALSSGINHYLVDSVIGSPNTYPLDSDLFSG